MRFIPFVTAIAFLAISCSVPSAPAPNPAAETHPAAAAQPTVTAARPPAVPTATAPPAASPIAAPPGVNVEVYAKNLQAPWGIERAPDGRFFLTERPGRVRIIKGGQLQTEPWISLPVAEISEAGLLGLAIDPQFNQNRFIYVAYTFRDGLRLTNRLVRLREDSNGKGVVDRILIDDISGSLNHDGGRVKFGPDGKLYWTMGDAQNTSFAQDLKSLNGKILRLNADGSVPADNPFPNSFVYSYGHRNPQGLAWQPGTNRLYETEHGPSGVAPSCCRDEVNFIEPGKNYGWPDITGDQTRTGLISPILHSGATETWAPGGATFVTGGPWEGSLLFTGLRGESLYRITLDKNDPRKVTRLERQFRNQFGRLRDVYQAPDGAIYVLTSNRDGRGQAAAEDDRVLRLTFR